MKQEVLIMVGISGSGKTTYTKQWLKTHPNYIRINRDDIRKVLVQNLDGYYQRTDLQELEAMVTSIETTIFNRSIIKGFNVVIDNTNLTKEYVFKWTDSIEVFKDAKDKEIKLMFKILDVDPTICKTRVMYRDNFMENQTDDAIANFIDKVAYIDKQASQFKNVREYIKMYFQDKIII